MNKCNCNHDKRDHERNEDSCQIEGCYCQRYRNEAEDDGIFEESPEGAEVILDTEVVNNDNNETGEESI